MRNRSAQKSPSSRSPEQQRVRRETVYLVLKKEGGGGGAAGGTPPPPQLAAQDLSTTSPLRAPSSRASSPQLTHTLRDSEHRLLVRRSTESFRRISDAVCSPPKVVIQQRTEFAPLAGKPLAALVERSDYQLPAAAGATRLLRDVSTRLLRRVFGEGAGAGGAGRKKKAGRKWKVARLRASQSNPLIRAIIERNAGGGGGGRRGCG